VSSQLPPALDFPYVAQVARIERVRVRLKDNAEQREIVFAITSLRPDKADAHSLLSFNRGHWAIENRLHYVRDRTYDEDRSQVRKQAAPHMMASLRNLAIGLMRLAGATNIAAAARFFMRHTEQAMEGLGVPSAVAAWPSRPPHPNSPQAARRSGARLRSSTPANTDTAVSATPIARPATSPSLSHRPPVLLRPATRSDPGPSIR